MRDRAVGEAYCREEERTVNGGEDICVTRRMWFQRRRDMAISVFLFTRRGEKVERVRTSQGEEIMSTDRVVVVLSEEREKKRV